MKNERLRMIREAARDPADGGTWWKKRLERWMNLPRPIQGGGLSLFLKLWERARF